MLKQPEPQLLPVIKWAGGKRWLTPTLIRLAGTPGRRLIEPFFGGGAFFFAYRPTSAVLADTNSDLINAYLELRDNPQAVFDHLDHYTNSAEEFYRIRAMNPTSAVERAARMFFLCRHSFNGIYRVNRAGSFNVPYGQKAHRATYDREALLSASEALQYAHLVSQDFEVTMQAATQGDVVYADPPYTVAHNNNGFVKYNEVMFSFEDQRRLARSARLAAANGAKVLVSNADHQSIRELYEGCQITELQRHSVVGSKPAYRRAVSELLIEVCP